MNVLQISAEFFPLIKTGGLADVVGALPNALMSLDNNIKVRVLLPGFPAVLRGIPKLSPIIQLNTFAGNMTLSIGIFEELDIYVIQADHIYNREGNPYHNIHLDAYADNYLRFALLGWVASELAIGALDKNWKADVVHAHDWHAGLTCAYLKARNSSVRSIFTIHNLAYQGVFPANLLSQLNLPSQFFQIEGLEFYGSISYLKAGIFYADHITSVSPTYCKEITQYESGFGLHGLLTIKQERLQLTGILNGVDDQIWNPLHDKFIAAPFDSSNLLGKAICKKAIQAQLNLPQDEKILLFGVVSRLTEQKGLDWVISSIAYIVENGCQIIILGSGDIWMEEAFTNAAKKFPKNIAVQIGHNDPLAHQIIAGVDVVLVPSRFEPCGLTQLYALKYGTLPLVRSTGGLADTVIDTTPENIDQEIATGIVFHGSDVTGLVDALKRSILMWANPHIWIGVQKSAMKKSFSWKLAATEYLKIYK